jgi:hypothetical protein
MQVLIGFAPWIAWWVLAANNTYREAALVALVLAVVIQLWGFLHGREPKILDLASIAWFVIIEVVAYTSSASDLGHYAQPASSAALTLIILFTILIGRPFTEEYARETVPKEYWETTAFKSTTRTIAWAWFFALLIGTATGFIRTRSGSDAETWTQWIIPIALIVIAVKFTEWWPDEYQRRHPSGADEPATS